jgi:hypothetical protein
MLKKIVVSGIMAVVASWTVVSPAKAIVGGAPVSGGYEGDAIPNPNPYAFVGRLVKDNGVGCTASLVAPLWAMSAGHCRGNGEITFGMLNKNRDRSTGISRRIDHEWFYADAPVVGRDGSLMLIRLSSPIYDIQPVRLGGPADRSLWRTGTQVTALGWGQINDTLHGTGIWSAELRRATLRVSDTAVSIGFYRGLMKLSSVSGHPTHGDSGGPVIVGDGQGGLIQFGVYEARLPTGGLYYNRTWPIQGLLSFVQGQL